MTWFSMLPPSLRTLRRSPVYSFASAGLVVTAAVASGTVFALVQAAFFEAAPYRDSARLVTVMASSSQDCGADCPDLLSTPAYQAVESQSRSLAETAVFRWIDVAARSISRAGRLPGAAVDPLLFRLLGVPPKAGRALSNGDDSPGAELAVVVSERLWRKSLGADPRAVGSSLTLSGRSFTIVGIMPRQFRYPSGAELWIPLSQYDAPPASDQAYAMVARLGGGITLEAVRAELSVVGERLHGNDRQRAPRSGITALSLKAEAAEGSGNLWLLSGAVGVLLTIAVVSLQTLALTRGLERNRELMIRAALGASAAQLLRVVLAEGAWLAGLASLITTPLVAWSLRTAPDWLPLLRISILPAQNFLPLLVALLVVAVCVGFTSITSAASALRTGRSGSLRPGTSSASAPAETVRIRRFLIGIEVATASILISLALATARVIDHLWRADLGYDARGLIVAPLDLQDTPLDNTAATRTLAADLVRDLASHQGVQAAAWTVTAPNMMIKPASPT